MKSLSSPKRMGLAVLAGGLAFMGPAAEATELIVDGSFENTSNSSLPVVKVGGKANPAPGEGWSTFSTYLYSTLYTLPGPTGSGGGYLRPYASGTYGVTQSSTKVEQSVVLTAGTTLTPAKIDAGSATFTMSAWFSSYLTQGDFSDLTLQFLSDTDEPVGEPIGLGGSEFIINIPTGANSKYGNAKEFAQDVRTGTIPAGARRARVTIQSTSVGGAPDGYVDLVSLDVQDTALTVPAVASAIPGNNAVGVGPVVNIDIKLQDRVKAVNPATIQLFLDGTPVTPVINRVPPDTTVTYDAGVLPALSKHKYTLIFADNGTPATKQTNEFNFTVADFLTLPAALATPLGSENTAQPGFKVAAYQVDPKPSDLDPAPAQVHIPNSIAFGESVLAGLLGANLADLTGAATGNSFDVPGTLNWANATGVAANFPDDTAFPGIPGTSGSETDFVHEIVTYVRFPAAGFYRMGINNEDAFRLTAATTGVQTLRLTSPASEVIPAVPIATNITQLQFGGALPATPLSASVIYATPSGSVDEACNLSGRTDLAGKIVLLDRGSGSCSSADKAKQAQLAGAVAVIETTPGDVGFPFRLGDIDPTVQIPVLVISDEHGGSSLKAKLLAGTPVSATIQTDTNARLAEWDGPKGFGAVDVTFGFAVPQAGVYPLRLVAMQETGNANLEWFTIKADGTRVLLNDPSDSSALKAFRSRTAVVVQPKFNAPVLNGQNLTLSWTGTGTLEVGASPTGPWVAAPSQANPQVVTVEAAATAKLYRIKQ
jgi:hypothetical protein